MRKQCLTNLQILACTGVPCILSSKEQDAKTRTKLLNQFKTAEGPLVLICTDGINMAGHELQRGCCVVIAMEPSWNYATDMQASTRVHRLGQLVEQEFLRPTVQNTYLEVHQVSMIRKLKGLIAAMGGDAKASAEEGTDVSAQELAERAFGILRRQVQTPASGNDG
jgi:SNF2 family DNA or RNA helicase